ncbi:hypothetical protein M9458_036641, partial [Cirrhinus mrigala]
IVLPTLPVLQGAAVSSEHPPQFFPPGNVAGLGSSPPPRGSLGPLVQVLPAGQPFQDTVPAAHITPEASLERLVPLVDHLAAWKLLPNVSAWVLHTVERGYRIQFGAPPPPFNGVSPTLVGPEQGLVMEQEVATLLRKEAIEVVPPHERESGFYSRSAFLDLRMIRVTRRCLRALDMWRKPWFLSQGLVLGAPCRCVTLAMDASLTGWGAVMSGHPARGRQLTWHINCLEMLPVFRALKHFLPDLRDRHVLVRTDNTSVVSYINHQGGLRSRPLYKLAHQILVWSQDKLLSLRAVYVPGHLNLGADIPSRQGPRLGEWMLHPEVVKQIWRVFGPAQVDLFATRENTQCSLWYSLVHPAPLGLDAMVQTWPRLRLYAFPPIALLPGVLERVRRDGVSLLLVAPYWPGRVWFSDLISLLDGSPWEIRRVTSLTRKHKSTFCLSAALCVCL